MKTSIEENTTVPVPYTDHIKHYLNYVLSDLADRLKDQGEKARNKNISGLRLLDPSTCDYSPLTLLTGDTSGTRPLFTRILQLMAFKREKAITVIVPEGTGHALTTSLVCTQLCMDINSNRREWMNNKYFDSMAKDFKLIAESKLQIVDAPSLYASLAHASVRNDLDYLCVTDFPENDPVEELRTLKGFAIGRNIPVLVLNTGEPVDHEYLCEHIERYYHMEAVEDLEYHLTVGSNRLKAKEEATVTLNPTKQWIHSINSKCVYSMNVNGKTGEELKAEGK